MVALTSALVTVSLAGWVSACMGQEGQRSMVFIPSGEFVMGTSEDEAEALAAEYQVHPSLLRMEAPRRLVNVPGFLIDRYPVTNAEYREFVEATGHAAGGSLDRRNGEM